MRNKIITVFGFFILTVSFTVFAQKQEIRQTDEPCACNFQLTVQADAPQEGDGYVVDGAVKFVINRTGEFDQGRKYNFYYIVNNDLHEIKEQVTLPYTFSQTYRGLDQGIYQAKFMVRIEPDECGFVSVPLRVAHTQ